MRPQEILNLGPHFSAVSTPSASPATTRKNPAGSAQQSPLVKKKALNMKGIFIFHLVSIKISFVPLIFF